MLLIEFFESSYLQLNKDKCCEYEAMWASVSLTQKLKRREQKPHDVIIARKWKLMNIF